MGKLIEKKKEPELETSKLPEIKKIEKPGEVSPFNFVSDFKKTTEKVEENAKKSLKELDKETANKRKDALLKMVPKITQLYQELEPIGDKADNIRDKVKKAKESSKIEDNASEQEIQKGIDKTTGYLNEAKYETDKLLKEGDLSQVERKILNKFIKNLDETLISLTKLSLSDRDTIIRRQNDEIFERTLIKNIMETRQIQNQVQEEAFIGLSKYYLALRDLSKEVEAVNSEKTSKKEKEQKVEEIFEKHYDTLKTGNEDHDKTLNSFLMYNITMEFGSKEQKENVSKEIKVKTEDGKETTLKDRCNKEILELVPVKE